VVSWPLSNPILAEWLGLWQSFCRGMPSTRRTPPLSPCSLWWRSAPPPSQTSLSLAILSNSSVPMSWTQIITMTKPDFGWRLHLFMLRSVCPVGFGFSIHCTCVSILPCKSLIFVRQFAGISRCPNCMPSSSCCVPWSL
jgi:hypothetical protein